MKSFVAFVQSLQLPPSIKTQLISPRLFQAHAFYIHIFEELYPAFINTPQTDLNRLALSGYCYFRSLLAFDQVIDETQIKTNAEHLYMGTLLHEKAIKELAYLFGEECGFWNDFDALKHQYYITLKQEKMLQKHHITDEIEALNLFEDIASGKSVMGVTAIAALAHLNKNHEHTADLEKSLLLYHIGLQILDDIDDFREDIGHKQWSYAQYKVHEWLKKEGIDTIDLSAETLNKYLYLSGVAVSLLEMAQNYFERSAEIAQKYNLEALCRRLQNQQEECKSQIKAIQQVVAKTHAKASLSMTFEPKLNIEDAINAGILFLERNFDSEKGWTDFLTSAGLSNRWVTGYVAYQLAQLHDKTKNWDEVLSLILAWGNEGFGYNATIMQDGDSSALCIGALTHANVPIPHNLLTSWLAFYQKGGWQTYFNAPYLRKMLKIASNSHVDGWTSPHVCVTALAASVLKILPEQAFLYKETLAYLANQQTKDGAFQSYWWTSDVYATAFSVQAFSQQPFYQEVYNRAKTWLLTAQAQNGVWIDVANGVESAFYTALALKAFCADRSVQDEQHTRAVQRAMDWLLRTQMEDGSWQTQRILRIPAPEVHDPKLVTKWRKSAFGVNTLIDDHNRIFTTATVLNALHHGAQFIQETQTSQNVESGGYALR